MMIFVCGCTPTPQRDAKNAIAGTQYAKCLSRAHWSAAIRRGMLTENPTGDGGGFVALDRPIQRPLSAEDYVYAPILVGKAKAANPFSRPSFRTDYERAGSPEMAQPSEDEIPGYDQRLFSFDDRGLFGQVRGEARGWLSRENDLNCGKDMHNGRFFIITEFTPAFAARSTANQRRTGERARKD